jgi:hypothetical protein
MTKHHVAPFQRKLSLGLVTVLCVPGLILGGLVMYLAWAHNSQGEFHEGGAIHWDSWLGYGASTFFIFSGIPLIILFTLAAMRRLFGRRDNYSDVPPSI